MNNKIFNMNLLNEIQNFSKTRHAEIVYKKCIRNKKFNLAEKIRFKYNLINKHDDMIMSTILCFNLIYNKNIKLF